MNSGTTGLSSVITCCNDVFVAISGFAREELVGQPHNLVRYPDMPSAVFGHMWETIKWGKPLLIASGRQMLCGDGGQG
jgi:aerotaxis receptor